MRRYKTIDGKTYPLVEARHDISFEVYKSDRRKAVIGDPTCCLLALGIKRDPNVLEAYIGSGKDAYVIFKASGGHPAECVHFTIPASSARVRDSFEVKGSPRTQTITLKRPTEARTIAARAVANKRRNDEVKAGTGKPVQHRGTPNKTRIMRIGVAHRPRAHIVKDVVEITPREDVSA